MPKKWGFRQGEKRIFDLADGEGLPEGWHDSPDAPQEPQGPAKDDSPDAPQEPAKKAKGKSK